MERNFQWDETGYVLLSFTPAHTFFFLTRTLATCYLPIELDAEREDKREKVFPKVLMSPCYCHKIGVSLKNK